MKYYNQNYFKFNRNINTQSRFGHTSAQHETENSSSTVGNTIKQNFISNLNIDTLVLNLDSPILLLTKIYRKPLDKMNEMLLDKIYAAQEQKAKTADEILDKLEQSLNKTLIHPAQTKTMEYLRDVTSQAPQYRTNYIDLEKIIATKVNHEACIEYINSSNIWNLDCGLLKMFSLKKLYPPVEYINNVYTQDIHLYFNQELATSLINTTWSS